MKANPNQIWQIASYSMRFSMRTGGGLMYLVVMLIGGLAVAAIFISPLDQLVDGMGLKGVTDPGQLADELLKSEQVRGAVEWITGTDDAQADYMMEKKPALLSAIFVILLLIIPYTVCLGAFNQTAGDIGSKGLRFLMLRCERTNIFLGRFFGVCLFSIVASATVILLIIFYVHFKFAIYPLSEMLAWGFQCLLAVAFLSLPYIAMCAWISGKVGSAFASLALCVLAVIFSVVLLMIFKGMLIGRLGVEKDQLNWMMRLLPWGWKYDLMHAKLTTQFLAGAMQLGFTALFLFLGLRSFNKRDL